MHRLARLAGLMREIGLDRFLMGSDWPARATPGDYNNLLEAQLPLTRAEWIEVLSNRASVFSTDQSAISASRLARGSRKWLLLPPGPVPGTTRRSSRMSIKQARSDARAALELDPRNQPQGSPEHVRSNVLLKAPQLARDHCARRPDRCAPRSQTSRDDPDDRLRWTCFGRAALASACPTRSLLMSATWLRPSSRPSACRTPA